MSQKQSAKAIQDDARQWLFAHALPVWAALGADAAHGGVVEQCALDGSASDAGFKRVRVPARQLYVFSHASILGWPQGLAIARDLFAQFVATCWQGDTLGWAKTLTSSNQILDPTTDLYDNAFALFALAWYFRASKDPTAHDMMLRSVETIEKQLRHPFVGFQNQLPLDHGPRLQNPHMHLLEACIGAIDACDDAVFKRLANEVIDLFETKFFNPTNNILSEVFDDALNPLSPSAGQKAEPGHQFEWAWILSNAQRLLGRDLSIAAKGLVEFGERYGVHRDGPMLGTTMNTLNVDGSQRDAGSRTWPNTERLKAAVAMYELFGQDPWPVIGETMSALNRLHLHHPIQGLWRDAFDEVGNCTAKAIPTSTFYHIFLALAEVLRLDSKA